MKKISLTALALAAALTGASPAFAQTFDGPYAGVQGGWKKDGADTIDGNSGPVAVDRSRDSGTVGVFGGYNLKATDKIVLSAEGSFNLGIDDRVSRAAAGTRFSIDPKYSFDLGVRAGYLVNDKTLVYARGGYENTRAKMQFSDAAGIRSDKDTLDGWSVGGGIERAIANRISARLEYRYSDLGSGRNEFDRHQALLGIAYHF